DAAAVLDQAWQPFGQALVQAGDGIRGEVFQLADVEPGFNDRAVGPDIRPAQVRHTEKLDVFLLCHVKISSRAQRVMRIARLAYVCLPVRYPRGYRLSVAFFVVYTRRHGSLPCRTNFCQSRSLR